MSFKQLCSLALYFIIVRGVASVAIPSVANCPVGSGMASSSSPCLSCSAEFFSLGGFNAACVSCGLGVSQCNNKTGVISVCASTYNLKAGTCVPIAGIVVKPMGSPKMVPTQ